MLEDCQGTLEDLHKVDVLEPNNEFTLKWHENVKRTLKDYRGTSKDLDKVDVVKTMLKDC